MKKNKMTSAVWGFLSAYIIAIVILATVVWIHIEDDDNNDYDEGIRSKVSDVSDGDDDDVVYEGFRDHLTVDIDSIYRQGGGLVKEGRTIPAGSTTIDHGIPGVNTIGPTGPLGPQGPRGLRGKDGIEGLIGPRGYDGPTGERGLRGKLGPSGPRGLVGPSGPSGEMGLAGPEGPAGERGTQGHTGPRGLTGDIGPPGPTGPKGETGASGPRGLEGPPGPKFEMDKTGLRGLMGPRGPRGDRGIRGPKGLKGMNGKKGPPGPRGPRGLPYGGSNVTDDALNTLSNQRWYSRDTAQTRFGIRWPAQRLHMASVTQGVFPESGPAAYVSQSTAIASTQVGMHFSPVMLNQDVLKLEIRNTTLRPYLMTLLSPSNMVASPAIEDESRILPLGPEESIDSNEPVYRLIAPGPDKSITGLYLGPSSRYEYKIRLHPGASDYHITVLIDHPWPAPEVSPPVSSEMVDPKHLGLFDLRHKHSVWVVQSDLESEWKPLDFSNPIVRIAPPTLSVIYDMFGLAGPYHFLSKALSKSNMKMDPENEYSVARAITYAIVRYLEITGWSKSAMLNTLPVSNIILESVVNLSSNIAGLSQIGLNSIRQSSVLGIYNSEEIRNIADNLETEGIRATAGEPFWWWTSDASPASEQSA
nr:MAG: hypothetical protein [Marsupenaeus japonicus pemonivirus]